MHLRQKEVKILSSLGFEKKPPLFIVLTLLSAFSKSILKITSPIFFSYGSCECNIRNPSKMLSWTNHVVRNLLRSYCCHLDEYSEIVRRQLGLNHLMIMAYLCLGSKIVAASCDYIVTCRRLKFMEKVHHAIHDRIR